MQNFAAEWMLKKAKGPSPFQFFSAFKFRLLKKFGCCRGEYFDILQSFCYFSALDMAPTWAGSDLSSSPFRNMNRNVSRFLKELVKFAYLFHTLVSIIGLKLLASSSFSQSKIKSQKTRFRRNEAFQCRKLEAAFQRSLKLLTMLTFGDSTVGLTALQILVP